MEVAARGLQGGWQLKLESMTARFGALPLAVLELIPQRLLLVLLKFPGIVSAGFFMAVAVSPLRMAEERPSSVRLLNGENVADNTKEILGAKMDSLEANSTNMMISIRWYAKLNFHHALILEITYFSLLHTQHIRLKGSKRDWCVCKLTGSSFANVATVSKEQVSATCFCCTRSILMVGSTVEGIVPFLFGLCHRRWTTAPSLLILRFNRRDSSSLSSVKANRNLQLNTHKPQVHTSERPLGESPTGHQLVWSTNEALGDCSCNKFEPELSTDDRPLFDSNCSLRYLLRKSWPSRSCSMQLSSAGYYCVVQFVSLYWDR